jgi:Cof subfamily protein (haloacid dehalogenase superfamily)
MSHDTMAPVHGSPIRLIGIDVDGTLVGSSGVVQPHVWNAVAIARDSGIHLTLCSGRPAFGIALEYARRLDPQGWHIFQNGASVVNLGTHESRSVAIPTPWVTKLIAQARDTGETLELYSDESYVVESTSDWAREHAELLGLPFEPRPFESLTQPVVRAQWLLSPAVGTRFMAVAHPGLEVAQSTSPLMRSTWFVGLTKEGVSKGTALRAVAGQYGVAMRDVMYVGDAGNDLSALKVAGHPVAMANADPAVLKAATFTAGDVDEGGLALALERAIDSTRS